MAEYNSQVMLITGIQGSGKTLSTLVRVKEWAESTKRKVYYARIKDLVLPWEELDNADEWFMVPDGSIVVIDEAQKGQFDKGWKAEKGASTSIAPAVRELETLRHRGINLVLISQHPMLLHPNVRRLCGLHYHVSRTFGMQQAMIFEWHVVQAAPETPGAKSQAIKHVFKYPKKAFEYYKSAEVHTIKRRIPMKVKLLLLLPLLLAVGIWYGYQKIVVERLGGNKQVEKVTGIPQPAGTLLGPQRSQSLVGPKSTVEYLSERTPRIAALPMTAPIYDKLMEPKVAPKPVACVASKTRCSCYTQQGTKLPQLNEQTCRSIVDNGYFDDAPDKEGGFYAKQDRNASLVAAVAPAATQATPGPSEGSGRASVVGTRETPWVADPQVRQKVTSPVKRQ